MTALDTNQDEKADPWELLCWVQWIEEVFQGVVMVFIFIRCVTIFKI